MAHVGTLRNAPARQGIGEAWAFLVHTLSPSGDHTLVSPGGNPVPRDEWPHSPIGIGLKSSLWRRFGTPGSVPFNIHKEALPSLPSHLPPNCIIPVLSKVTRRLLLQRAEPTMQRSGGIGFRRGHQAADVHAALDLAVSQGREVGHPVVLAKVHSRTSWTCWSDSITGSIAGSILRIGVTSLRCDRGVQQCPHALHHYSGEPLVAV